MTLIENLTQYLTNKDKCCYTFLIHNYINETLINDIKKKLENINKKITNSFKKKFINERIFSLITHLESSYRQDEEINAIFLIDKKVNVILLSKADTKFCNEWSIKNFYMEYDEVFQIEYLQDLFSTNLVKTVFKFDKTCYKIIQMDYTKSKITESHSNLEVVSITENITKHSPVVIYGMNQILKKLNHLETNKLSIILKNLTNQEIDEIIQKNQIIENQEMFKIEFLDNVENPKEMNKLIFGRQEVSQHIENSMIKKLFINPKLFLQLKNNADPTLLNFEIVIVKSIKTGDYGQQLNKSFQGMVGIKYY